MTSQWVMMLLGMPHCGTTMGNDVARDIHCDITMDNDIAMFSRDLHILDLQWRSHLCSLFALLLCSMTHYDFTMGHDVARDVPLWHNNGL